MPATHGRALPPDYLIQQRRKEEESRREMLQTTRYYAQSSLKSAFEAGTMRIGAENRIRRRYAELKHEEDSKIVGRRERLTALLAADEQQSAAALLQSDETVEQRMEKMRSRIKELRDSKEEERKRVVEQKMLQKWRNDCDELRLVESKVFEKQVSDARASQLVERKMQQLMLEEENRHFDKLWEQDRLKKVLREEKDQLECEKRNAEMIEMLSEQMNSLRIKAAEEATLKREEALLICQQAEMLQMQEERARLAKSQAQHRVHAELQRTNKLKAQEKARAAKTVLEFDLKVLDDVARMEADHRAFERHKKEELRTELQQYREYFNEHKRAEEQFARELDAMYQSEINKAWEVKAERLAVEQRNRERLMDEVLADRQKQIQERVAANIKQQEAIKREQHEIRMAIEQSKRYEQEQKRLNELRHEQYGHTLAAQIADVAARKRAEEEREQREVEKFKKMERDYTEMAKREIQNVGKQSKFFGIRSHKD